MRGTWPLVGRAEELRFVEQALDRPDAAGVVLAGPAGCGKTRLAPEALDAAHERRFATEWVVPRPPRPRSPSERCRHPYGGGSYSSDLRLLVEMRAILEERAAGRRLLVAIDDIHLLDATSAAFLRQIAGQGAPREGSQGTSASSEPAFRGPSLPVTT